MTFDFSYFFFFFSLFFSSPYPDQAADIFVCLGVRTVKEKYSHFVSKCLMKSKDFNHLPPSTPHPSLSLPLPMVL